MISYILAVVCGALCLGADQFSKYYISNNFELGQSKDFIKGIVDLVYIHNRGAAWGAFANKRAFLILITAVIMAFCIFLLIKYARRQKLLFWAIILVLSGGIGNMIDRIFRDGNVVDFLHFEFFPTFPVFNIADCAIVIGSSLLILYFIIDMIKEKRNKEMKKDAND